METRDPRASPEGQAAQVDGGLWMKLDSSPVIDHTESLSVTCGENQDETNINPPPPAANTKYYSVMDDEGVDDVFITPPPPSHIAPLLPAEGSTDATKNNSSVTLTKRAADATGTKANPSGLDWHHGEKQLMAGQNETDKVKENTVQTPKGSPDSPSPSADEDSAQPKDQDLTSMETTGSLMETSGRHNRNNTTRDEESNEEPENGVILSGGQKNWRETEGERDKYSKQVLSSSENETDSDKEEDETKSVDICGLAEADPKVTTENVDSGGDDTIAPTMSRHSVNDVDIESCEPPELCKCPQNKMEAATKQPQVPEIPTMVSNDDEEHVDTRSLNYTLTKYDWVRRESGTSEMQGLRLPVPEGSDETQTKQEQGDGSRRTATDLQQGEQLLQRLQLVQLRQDVLHTSQQVVRESTGDEKGVLGSEVDDLKAREELTGGDKEKESGFHTVEDKINLIEIGSKDIETTPGMSLSTMSAEPEYHMIARTGAGDTDDDQSDRWVPADLSPIDTHDTCPIQIPFESTQHRFSATETSIERQIHEAAEAKQNLQRAGGVFNLADNPDVLEIPFKSNISLEPLPTNMDTGQCSDRQFSEQKMQKEINQEIQRELVLVNQGKIPGGYSKGEVRQLKETKLLFESFQQDNTRGPTRHRKPPASLMKSHVYPTVLERTCSLERFSLKSCPVSRSHSLRLCNSATSETQKTPEDLRSKSPTGGSRDKTRLFPYPKQDKHMRLYRSMDSISTDVSKSAVEARCKTRQRNTTQESPILKQNPFFKLRPALALQPEVEKDIREAKKREEELRRQRCTLYGENRQNSEDGEKSRSTSTLEPDVRQQSRGKLERIWPPPSKKDQIKSEQTQQEAKGQRTGGQKAPLWQRWEAGLINGQPSKKNN